jgi:catalase
MAGFVSFAKSVEPNNTPVDKVRGKPEKFAEHYNQAALFFNSQTPQEQAHIIGAFRFELSKVTVPAIRKRVVATLLNVSQSLAQAVATGLGIELPEEMPRAISKVPDPEVTASKALSLKALPGESGIATRKIAILIANGVDGKCVVRLTQALTAAGAVTRLLGSRLGTVMTQDGQSLEVDATLENSPAVLFDAMVLPDGAQAVDALAGDGHTLEFLKDQYRHCKTILVLGAAAGLLDKIGIARDPPWEGGDPGLIVSASGDDADAQAFIEAIAQHRHPARDTDPPPI